MKLALIARVFGLGLNPAFNEEIPEDLIEEVQIKLLLNDVIRETISYRSKLTDKLYYICIGSYGFKKYYCQVGTQKSITQSNQLGAFFINITLENQSK